jgi:hypothetical protein
MKYQKQNQVQGSWIKGSDLVGIKEAKIVSETTPQSSQFTNKDGSPKTQDVCKIRFKGKDEAYNISLNKATINGLVDAFGEDSINWQNKTLSVETEKVRVAGVARVAIYLIPEGYEKIDNEEGFAAIVNKGGSVETKKDNIPIIEEEVNIEDVPF